MQLQRSATLGLLLAGLAFGACTDQSQPTAVPDGVDAAVSAAASPNSQKVSVKKMQLSVNTLRIDGPSVSGDVTIGNTGLAIPSGVVVRAEIIQGATSRRALNTPTQCSPAPGDAGKLPTGTCEMTFNASASNSAPGTGSLAPGSATFVLHVIQTSGTGDTELASKSLLVNLVATPGMSVTLAPTTLLIDGAAATATAVIQNPANSLQGVLLQGWIVQGQTRRAAGGIVVSCGSNAGVLPPGTCTMNVSASASNSAAGTGTLVAGAATFELDLLQTSGSTSTTFDVETVAITLTVPVSTSIRNISIDPQFVIGVASRYTVVLENTGSALTNVALESAISQGAARRFAGSRQIQCKAGPNIGGPVGELPSGNCPMDMSSVADNNNAGTGTLTPGSATLELTLSQQSGGGTTVLDTEQIQITLVGIPGIVSAVPASNFVVLDKPFTVTNATVTINNPGAAGSSYLLQGWIRQGTARLAAGGGNVTCGGGSGLLPTGSCTEPTVISASNSAQGTGTLVPGPATWEVELKYNNGTTETIVDTETAPITLVRNTPSIVSLVLQSTTIAIGGQTGYTATLYNPGPTLTLAGLQGYVEQNISGASSWGAGGIGLVCGAGQDNMATGSCVITFTVNPQNTSGTGPELLAGPATFRLQFFSDGGQTVLDEKIVAITLTAPQP
jgi:hypothetical protein